MMTEILDILKTTEELRILAFDGILKSPLRYLKYEFQTNQKFQELLDQENPDLNEIHQVLTNVPNEINLDAAIIIFIDEQKKIKESGTPWVIDDHSGMALVPINKDTLFTPMKTGPNGEKTPGIPILHPGISSKIALVRQELSQKSQLIKKFKGSTIEHIVRPSSILDIAKEELEKLGLKSSSIEGEEEMEEIGRENFDGLFQAPNEAFHRYALYGKLLARRIFSRRAASFELTRIYERSNSKSKWFDVYFRVMMPKVLLSQNPEELERVQKP